MLRDEEHSKNDLVFFTVVANKKTPLLLQQGGMDRSQRQLKPVLRDNLEGPLTLNVFSLRIVWDYLRVHKSYIYSFHSKSKIVY